MTGSLQAENLLDRAGMIPHWLQPLATASLALAFLSAATAALLLLTLSRREHLWIHWFQMQIGMVVGFFTSYPANWLLLRKGLKEPM
jgi:Domain of unknown function (DUF4396)